MLSNEIKVTFSQLESTKDHVFTVESYGHDFQTVYPEPLNELTQIFNDETSAWAQLVIDRVNHIYGNKWALYGKKDAASLLWHFFGDTPIDENECIDEPFLHFDTGTDRFDIWHWFEDYFDVSIANDLAKIA
jgi:hypothetical protein